MEWGIAISAIVVLGAAAAIAAGSLGQMSREPVRDTYRQDLPDHPLTARDVQQVRFGVQLRGYAMDQVDDVLARLSHEIAERDARIAALAEASRCDLRSCDGGGSGHAGSTAGVWDVERAADGPVIR